jgi:hypothetical protein
MSTQFRVSSMQTRHAVHIMAPEWRWVMVVGSALILLTFAPLVWVALTGASDWQFMGALHNYQDGATYLSKMEQGERGNWLIAFQHTPEPMAGAFIQVIYPLLGHLSRLSSVPPAILFHVARVGASLFMYAALYHLGASIWAKTRTRRIFFVFAAVGSGFGWLLMPLLGDPTFPDVTLPEAFPLYSTYMNVHFPLTIACLSLLISLFVGAFRPGADEDPTIDRSLVTVGILSVALALLYPHALVPFGGATLLHALVSWRIDRQVSARTLRWLAALILPALPLALYYLLIITHNPALAEWNRQNVTAAPNPLNLALGFGIPLILAVPGIWRGVRRFERDGDRLMLLWLVSMVIAIYLPTNAQRRFAVGMMIPIAYFAARAMEDVWLPRLGRRLRPYAFAVFVPLIAMSSLLLLFLPVLPVVMGNPQVAVGVFLEREYADAYQWLDERTSPDDVILAAPVVSAWIPAWAGAKVVYGHPYETLDATANRQAVWDWYGAANVENCAALLDRYDVRYVLHGPEERRLGDAVCLDTLQAVAQFGSVTAYAR